jgi:hypothetical protein
LLPHFLDNRLTDGGEVVSLSAGHSLPKEDSWYSFLLALSRLQDHSDAGRIRSIEKSNDLIGKRGVNILNKINKILSLLLF